MSCRARACLLYSLSWHQARDRQWLLPLRVVEIAVSARVEDSEGTREPSKAELKGLLVSPQACRAVGPEDNTNRWPWRRWSSFRPCINHRMRPVSATAEESPPRDSHLLKHFMHVVQSALHRDACRHPCLHLLDLLSRQSSEKPCHGILRSSSSHLAIEA